MSGTIYLIQGDQELVEMNEQSYDSEDLLQGLLAKYPNLLAGDQMDDASPRRWLLISREASLPSEEDGAGRWSVDHLFLDQAGIPTLVEVKRSSDTRLRREVVGQMLDYAANAVAYWPEETIRARFEARCESQGADPAQEISDLGGFEAGEQQGVEAFWEHVKTNLQAGRIRLVFVADQIPQELRRIVEFLNIQMDPAEVLAVEIKQYVEPDTEHAERQLRTLVPRVIGQRAKSVAAAKRKWDEVSFFSELERRFGADLAAVARRILEWATERDLRIWWGEGAQDGSFIPTFDWKGKGFSPIIVWTYGRVELQFQHMKKWPPFDEESNRLEFLRSLNALPGISIPEESISRRPAFFLSELRDEDAMRSFLDTFDWAIEERKKE